MSNIFRLSPQHFEVAQAATQPGQPPHQVLRSRGLQGLVLVMFSSEKCGVCRNLIPVFTQQLPRMVPNCSFAIADVELRDNEGKSILDKAQLTVRPIKSVPTLVMYVDNRPFMMYHETGPRDAQSLAAFVADIAREVSTGKKSYTSGQVCAPNTSNPNAPASYCSYKPTKDARLSGFCDLDTAYGTGQGKAGDVYREGFMLLDGSTDSGNSVNWCLASGASGNCSL